MDFKKIIKNSFTPEIILAIIGFLLILFYILLNMRVNDGILGLLIMLMCFLFGMYYGLMFAEVI